MARADAVCSASPLRRRALSVWRLLPCLALAGGLLLPAQAHADNTLLTASVLGYQDPQDGPSGAPGNQDAQGEASDANSGPVRLARFSLVTGDVTWRDSTDGSWSAASQNMPLRQGAQIWVSDGGRAEVQLDDGSRIRLDSNTLITLQTLYSDADGEFTEITLNDGQVYLHLNNKYSLYQVNTPQASLKAVGPAQIRVEGGKDAGFGVRSGSASVEGKLGKADLNAGDFVYTTNQDSRYIVKELPNPDNWDTWNLRRDEALDNAGRSLSPHLPSNIALVADNLDEDGSWHNDAQYGWVWSPRVADPGWRPYRAGHWTWVEPFGWTWVSTERWGWAPYHYGTWVHQPYGWAWCPGPSVQYWSPGVVSFTESNGVMAWCPLAPHEVRYPSRLTLGFRNGNWSAFFSIGGAAVYYPTSARYCEPRPFRNVYINRVTYVNHVTNVYNVTNITVNRNTYLTNAHFLPANARWQGGTQVAVASFGGKGLYQPVAGGTQSIFARGRVISAPVGGRPVAGPQSVHVTAAALTPARSYQAPTKLPAQYVNRTVYRAALPSKVPTIQSQPQRGQQFVSHSGTSNSNGTTRNGSVPNRTNLPGRPTEEKSTFNSRPTGTNRVTDGNGSRPTNPNGNTGRTGRSQGLDDYLKNRKTGNSGDSTGKQTLPNGKNDTTSPRRFGDGTTGSHTDTTTPRRTGDTGTTRYGETPRRFGDSPNNSHTDTTRRTGEGGTNTPRRFGDNPTSKTDTTSPRRFGDGPTSKTDTTPPRRFGDGPNTPRNGDRTGTSKTDTSRNSGNHTSGSSGDSSRTSRSGGTGSGNSSGSRGSGSGKSDSGKGDSGKSGRTSDDPKKDNSKDRKNP